MATVGVKGLTSATAERLVLIGSISADNFYRTTVILIANKIASTQARSNQRGSNQRWKNTC